MISVLVYGRNDAHGYNLHRRVALSLNCLAEVLTDPDDEIVFVDYNTPDELPTVVEALADSLTERCLSLLRVIRVPAWLHTERYADSTHLAVVEPVARNTAARRANPSNRWLLFTNTDMIFVPLRGSSLSDACRDLADGFYALPRFEIPEWVWERLPRSDPQRTLIELARLGPGLHLDEPTRGDEWVRFDAPGDFQLVLREDLFSIDGFDEAMLLGWHVDSNLSRRLLLHRGAIESLEKSVAGYHCNHSRVPTAYHGAERISNDLDRFFYSVERAPLEEQRATWGLADVAVQEVPLTRQVGSAFVDALLASLANRGGARTSSDAVTAALGTTYDSGHVLPFVADSLVVSPLSRIGYLGINPILQQLLGGLVGELATDCRFRIVDLEDTSDIDDLAQSTDLFVVDFGTDALLVEPAELGRFGDMPADVPVGLDLVFAGLERLVEIERARVAAGKHPRRFVLVNSSTAFFDAYVSAQFNCSSTTVHCRVRRATVKASADDAATLAVLRQARALARWALRPRDGSGLLRVQPGKPCWFAVLDDYSGLAAGWTFPDERGIWTCGTRSELVIAFPQVEIETDGCILVLVIDGVCVGLDELLAVELFVDGARLLKRNFSQADAPFAWRVELPPHVLRAGTANLTISIDEPRSPLAIGSTTDQRPLGIRVRSLTLGEVDRSVEPGRKVAFEAGMDGERLLAEGWSLPEASGVWSESDRACLVLDLRVDPGRDALLVFDVAPFVMTEHPELVVDVVAFDTPIARRVFRHGEVDGRLVLCLPPSVRDERGRTVLEFRFDQPARPVDIGLSSDKRRLGLLLRSFMLTEVDRSVEPGRKVAFEAGMDGERLLAEGWSLPEASGVWSESDRACLVLDLRVDPGRDALLVFDVAPFVMTEHPELVVDVVAFDTPIARRVFRHGEVDGRLVLCLPPSVRDERGRTVLEFRFDQPARPVDIGLSSDKRRLGLLLRSFMLTEVDRSLEIDQVISFDEGSGAERFLGDGWSYLERKGVWTIADSAQLIFQIPSDAAGALELILAARAFVGPQHPTVAVHVAVGDRRLGDAVFRHGVKNSVLRVPLGDAREYTGAQVVLALEVDAPVSPRALGISVDDRLLGLHLERLSVCRARV